VAVRACKEAVNTAEETTLRECLRLERRLFHSLFATEDQKEVRRCLCSSPSSAACDRDPSARRQHAPQGMAAFLEKRTPNFTDKKRPPRLDTYYNGR